MTMKIEIENGRAYITSPYNQEFVTRVKNIGGRKWEADRKSWSVPAEAVDAVRAIMMDVYGETDQAVVEKVTVKVIVKMPFSTTRGDVVLLGKTLSHAYGRDSSATCGDGVSYIKGKCTSGGSVKNWRSGVSCDSEIILTDVPRSLVDAHDWDDELIDVEIVEVQDNRKALEEEKNKLLARLAEIEKLLGGM